MRSLRIGGMTVLTVLALAACDDTNSPEDATTLLDDDVAMVAAHSALDDLASLGDPGALRDGGPGFGTRTVTYLDAQGNEQDDYDELTTASVRIVMEVNHSASREFWEASIEFHRDMTISGLVGEETTRIVNGAGSSSVDGSRHSDAEGTRSYEMSGGSTTEDVVLGVPSSENPWPLSGTITRLMTVTITNGPNGDETKERNVVITFNGTQFPDMTVNGEPFEVDLAARDDRRPFRRRHR